ncbi:hypothetical protein [Andreprevotia chitinilytica]|uniref:hypothetical protein n=1 Tax=Andreprevotia chitinilytica TaxID=396808 RepID=UPI000557DEA2|nr:hypothetical protein [Andreprevotia chitinilytica]
MRNTKPYAKFILSAVSVLLCGIAPTHAWVGNALERRVWQMNITQRQREWAKAEILRQRLERNADMR